MIPASPARRLRLVHFTLDSDTSGYFPQLARWHDRVGFEMKFATLRATDQRLAALMRAHDVPTWSCHARSTVDYPMAALRLARMLRRERIDICHVHLYHPSLVGLWAACLARTPFRVQTRHYSDYHTRVGRTVHLQADRLCALMSHAVIAVSQHTADHLVNVERVSPRKVHVIPNGIDFERVQTSTPSVVSRLRAEHADSDDVLLLVVGRLHPEKGYEQLFLALRRVVDRARPFVRLLVAGRGPYESAYKAQVGQLGLEAHVRFLGFRHDIADLMAAADIFVLPSLAEAFGLAVAEALYLGVPVLATRCGGIPEIVDDGRDGLLVPPGDADALAEALVLLVNDPDRRRALAGTGRQKVRERFAFERMIRAYEALYLRGPGL